MNKIIIDVNEINELRKALSDSRGLSQNYIKEKGWSLAELDDINIFEEDSLNLERALKKIGLDEFYAVKAEDIMTLKPAVGVRVNATEKEIENFQGVQTPGEVSLFDCVMFGLPIKFLIYRTETVEFMQYAGPKEFIDIATQSEGWVRKF